MTRHRRLSLSLIAALLTGASGSAISVEELRTDVNIVTALDVSDSIDAQSTQIEIEGMAQAILAPEILQAIRAGRHRRVGFAIFAWHEGAYPELLSWTIIGDDEDARAVSEQLRNVLPSEFGVSVDRMVEPRMTDLSGAIDHAAVLLLTAPFATDRMVLNVVGNGWDNVGEGPIHARDRLVGEGGTINGVILGEDPVLADYFRQNVIGGRGAFLFTARDKSAITSVLARKFLRDVALATPNPLSAP
jgi:Ca-activated chloride channel homolog